MKNSLRGIIFLGICVFSLNLQAQSQKKVQKTIDKRQEQLDKQEQDKKAQAEQEMEEKKRRHFEMQSKEVQKRMKKTAKQSKRHNDNKREFFLKRWFTKR